MTAYSIYGAGCCGSCPRLGSSSRPDGSASRRSAPASSPRSPAAALPPSVLASASPREELLASYNEIDIALDPFPFGGGTTTLEALWMGVPVVTMRSDRFAGRVGVSILETAGLAALIAADHEDYLATALALAHDRPLLATMRAVLRRRLVGSPLCDNVGFARDLEAAYVAMRHSAQLSE